MTERDMVLETARLIDQLIAERCRELVLERDELSADLSLASQGIVRLMQERDALAEENKALRAVRAAALGFADAVRLDAGKAYPWPALDIAEEALRAISGGTEAKCGYCGATGHLTETADYSSGVAYVSLACDACMEKRKAATE